MKQQRFTTIILSLTMLCVAATTNAQESYSLKSSNASIEGTSSLHDWKSEITNLQFKGQFDVHNRVLESIKNVEIKMLVEGIKSTKGKTMNDKTYAAFKSEANPYIIYTFMGSRITTSADNIFIVDATGNLTMAGETKRISLKATVNVLPNGDLQVSVSEKIKMTDYKMKKPTAMLGTITVGDEVNVSFNLVLTPGTPQAKSK